MRFLLINVVVQVYKASKPQNPQINIHILGQVHKQRFCMFLKCSHQSVTPSSPHWPSSTGRKLCSVYHLAVCKLRVWDWLLEIAGDTEHKRPIFNWSTLKCFEKMVANN